MSGNTAPNQFRLSLVLLLMASAGLALVWRLASLQIGQHEEFARRAEGAHWDRQVIAPVRGAIKDRNGFPLAIAVSAWEVSLDFHNIRSQAQKDNALRAVARTLGISDSEMRTRAAGADQGPVRITENLDYPQGKLLAQQALPGIVMQERVQRTYPEGSIAAGLLGFIGRDREGLTGIEADYDRDLAGVPGVQIFERDSLGNPIPVGYRSTTPAQPGGDVILTIDRYIQRIAERELDAAVKQHNADGGTIIVMEPDTGAVLAMASRPTVDLTRLDLSDPKTLDLSRNRAITDLYEPGSTFKLITMSSAINEGAVTPNTTHLDAGPNIKYGWPIDNWDFRHWGVETMTQVLIRSNNVGAMWAAEQLGTDRFYEYLKKFGFGQPTYIGLSGEATGSYRKPGDPGYSPIDSATNAFGQGITVTPIQLATAECAVINGGRLMRPYVVQRIESAEGVREMQPVLVRQVLSEQTSQQLRDMMKAVAEQGTSGKADVPGFTVGVKTGTANMIAAEGGYSEATIASIVGFFPYPDPKALVLVKLDHPRDTPWGSQAAAPVFAKVARETLVYWRERPTRDVMVSRIP